MADLILLAVLAVILGGAAAYVIREKKRGRKCIGCPERGCGTCSCGKFR